MRSAEITRQVLLRAALKLFAEEGFETVGVRDIGLRAKVDPSLVNRYYGGKDELFIEVVKACEADWRRLWGEKTDFAARVAKEVLQGGNDGKVLQGLLILLRVTGSERARHLVDETLGSSMFGQVESWLDGPDADVRARLLIALIGGMAFARDLSGDFPLKEARAAALAQAFEASIEQLLTSSPKPISQSIAPPLDRAVTC